MLLCVAAEVVGDVRELGSGPSAAGRRGVRGTVPSHSIQHADSMTIPLKNPAKLAWFPSVSSLRTSSMRTSVTGVMAGTHHIGTGGTHHF